MKRPENTMYSILRIVLFLVMIVAGIAGTGYAAGPVSNTFVGGKPIVANDVNANFKNITDRMPAVWMNNSNTDIAVNSTAKNILSITVTAPASGSMLVTATGRMGINQSTAQYNYIQANITTTSGDLYENPSKQWTTFFGINPGTSYHPLTWAPFTRQEIFTVSAGASYTFYLVGMASTTGAACYISSPMLIVNFFAD